MSFSKKIMEIHFPISHVKVVPHREDSKSIPACICEPKCKACENGHRFLSNLVAAGEHVHVRGCPAPFGAGSGFNHG